jgi:hypothetical protein
VKKWFQGQVNGRGGKRYRYFLYDFSDQVFPYAKLVSFPNLDHIQANARVDLVIPMLKELLAQVSKA